MRVKDFKASILVYLEGQKDRLKLLREGAFATNSPKDAECYYDQQALVEMIINKVEQLGHAIVNR
jgi:hypothetical protein